MRVELVKSELNFDLTCADFLDFLNKPEQVELLKKCFEKQKIYVDIKLVSFSVILFIIYVIFQFVFLWGKKNFLNSIPPPPPENTKTPGWVK
jgi:hypothetical protein